MMQHTTPSSSFKHTYILAFLGVLLVSVAVAVCVHVPSAHAVTAAEKQAEAEAALANLTAMQVSRPLVCGVW